MPRKMSFKLNRDKVLSWTTKISAIVWVGCIIGVFALSGYVTGVRRETFDKTPDVFAFSLLGLVLLGCLAFLIGITSFTAQLIIRRSHKKQNIFIFLIKLFFTLAILPLYLIIHILKSLEFIKKLKHDGIKSLFKSFRLKPILAKVIALIAIGAIILPIWIGGYVAIGALVANQLGYITKNVNIIGTGSMYPTWEKGTKGKSHKELVKEIVSTAGFLPYPNGIVIGGKRYLGHTLGRGDIIIWENDATRELTSRDRSKGTGLIKRIIGLPGDTIELRDGIVYLNGEPQKEPYIAKPHSTFGEKFLRECQIITVPQDTVFAMGDNRKGSSDSRKIGFAPIKDIRLVIPLEKQKGQLDKNWHDTSNDLDSSTKPKINREKFVELLNQKRKEKGVPKVKYEPKLEKSAALRGEAILKDNDFEEKGSYTMRRSMADAGYWNNYWWEVSIQGYYEAEELIEDYLERDWTDETWFDKKFDDVGIAEVEGTLNGCPTQVIAIHVAGYDQDNIDSWKTKLSRLREIQPKWASLKDNAAFYQKNKGDVDRINEIISIRIANISAIVSRMEANQWLTVAEQKMVDQEKPLYDEQDMLANRLKSQY